MDSSSGHRTGIDKLDIQYLFTNGNLNQALRQIDSLKIQVNEARGHIEKANRNSDTLSLLLHNYSAYIDNINMNVQALETARRMSDDKHRSDRKKLSQEIDSLESRIDSVRINLPEINILP